MVAIPEYVPIPRDLTQTFERLRDTSLPQSELRETERDLLKSAVEFLDQIVEDGDDSADTGTDTDRLEPLKRLLASFETIVQTQAKTKQFTQFFDESKQAVRVLSKNHPELSIDTMDHLNDLDPNKVLFSRILESRMEHAREVNIQSKYKSDPDYQYLKNAAFILDHPLDPIPDETEGDDDDIQVEGGKVDIKCPISMKIFEKPMTSTKCNHTFDEEAIVGTWSHPSMVQHCPVPGCGYNLRRTDFVPDRLMNLRVKSYNRLQKKMENQQHYEKL